MEVFKTEMSVLIGIDGIRYICIFLVNYKAEER